MLFQMRSYFVRKHIVSIWENNRAYYRVITRNNVTVSQNNMLISRYNVNISGFLWYFSRYKVIVLWFFLWKLSRVTKEHVSVTFSWHWHGRFLTVLWATTYPAWIQLWCNLYPVNHWVPSSWLVRKNATSIVLRMCCYSFLLWYNSCISKSSPEFAC